MSNEDIEVVHEEGGYRAVLLDDDNVSEYGPREAANLGIMWTRHGRYTLGDNELSKDVPEFDELNSFIDHMLEWHSGEAVTQAVVKHLVRKHEATVVLPLYLYDHSGLSISASTNLVEHLINTGLERRRHFVMDPGGWDTSYLGFIFDSARTREQIGTTPEHVEAALRSEVDEYDKYLRGEVYGVRIERLVDVTETVKDPVTGEVIRETEDDDWDEVESCWGFVGHEYAQQEAREMLTPYVSPKEG